MNDPDHDRDNICLYEIKSNDTDLIFPLLQGHYFISAMYKNVPVANWLHISIIYTEQLHQHCFAPGLSLRSNKTRE